jgi:hypothetical protein
LKWQPILLDALPRFTLCFTVNLPWSTFLRWLRQCLTMSTRQMSSPSEISLKNGFKPSMSPSLNFSKESSPQPNENTSQKSCSWIWRFVSFNLTFWIGSCMQYHCWQLCWSRASIAFSGGRWSSCLLGSKKKAYFH